MVTANTGSGKPEGFDKYVTSIGEGWQSRPDGVQSARIETPHAKGPVGPPAPEAALDRTLPLTQSATIGAREKLLKDNTGIVCFTSGTAIRTPMGDVLIDHLRPGDVVSTMDNGPQEIRWIGKRALDRAALTHKPNLRPVLIPKGVMGADQDLLVSRQHGMLLDRDTLTHAIHLCGTKAGIQTANAIQNVTYIHIMFDDHQIIFANNVASESFYPGSTTMQMMGEGARVEVLNLFPALRLLSANATPDATYGALARKFLRRRDMKSALKTD